MNIKFILSTILLSAASLCVFADEEPTISPVAVITDTLGNEKEITSHEASAPLPVRFEANPSNTEGYTEYYEWRFYKEGEEDSPYLVRYEQNTEYTFTTSGAHRIVCYAMFTQGEKTVAYTQEYWNEKEPIKISIYESKLEMPNAFSPNGDYINDTYHAKDGYQSIVEFHAYIFNRWGQKLYEWHDPAGGWDGKFNGHDVAQGVYFCLVKAKGADGRTFNIRKDVNLLRGFTDGTSTTGEE